MENYKEWLNEEVPDFELDEKDGALFIPIWVVESLLDELSGCNWNRYEHKYSLHPDSNGVEWLATSHLLDVFYGDGKRTLLCSSFINPQQYPDAKNLLQTGIAEATKAGVKVLGVRFGKSLNERTTFKKKKAKVPIKRTPDKKVLQAYADAIQREDEETISKIESMYNIKTQQDVT